MDKDNMKELYHNENGKMSCYNTRTYAKGHAGGARRRCHSTKRRIISKGRGNLPFF